jgi:pimeloyl-ACP methyl ester carboxylesterase
MAYIKLRGNNHFYEVYNTDRSETILLVHGHPFNHTMWRYQYNALQNFRLLLPDLKGYGNTDYRFDRIFIEEQALDLALLLDALNIERVHLMGLSMGGQIIVEFARLFPHRTQSLIICDSNPAGETPSSRTARLQLADNMLSIGMEQYTTQDIHKYLHADTIANESPAYLHLRQMMLNTKVEGAVAAHRGRAERRDNFSYLHKIEVPALVIVGSDDFFTPVADMQQVAGELPNAQLVVIENAGHMPNMEQPGAFNETVTQFYKRITNGTLLAG